MKKLVVLILSLFLLVGLTWYALKLKKNKGKSDTELIEFAVDDIATVDRVIITDKFGQVFELIKQINGNWTDKTGGCVIPENVDFILDAFKKIEFKGYVPETARKRYVSLMSSQHIKVEIFQNGAWSKTWFIGPATPDHYGQIMLLDSKEYGKSDNAVMMKIKGLNGIIDPRFFADERQWRCTNIFKLSLNQISKIDVKFNDEPARSFTVTKNGPKLNVLQQGKKLPAADTSMILRYLNSYQKVHYENPNFELNQKQIDSLKKTTPFCVLTVSETNKKSTKLKLYRLTFKENEGAGIGEVVNMDRNKLWVELPTGDIVKCQYFVFNPLILGHVYFPAMDLSGIKTHDGILKIDE